MKRWFAMMLILMLVFVLNACGEPAPSGAAVANMDIAQLNFPGLEWNMMEEEVLAALELTGDDWTSLIDSETSIQRLYRVNETMALFGSEARVYLFFYSHVEGQMGLQNVYVLFPDTVDPKTLWTDLEAQLGLPTSAGSMDAEKVMTTWSASETLESYAEEAFFNLKEAYPDNYTSSLERVKDTAVATLSLYSYTKDYYDTDLLAYYDTEPLPMEYENGCMLYFRSSVTACLQYINNGGYPLPKD